MYHIILELLIHVSLCTFFNSVLLEGWVLLFPLSFSLLFNMVLTAGYWTHQFISLYLRTVCHGRQED